VEIVENKEKILGSLPSPAQKLPNNKSAIYELAIFSWQK